jgi:hypothetical protein
MLQDDFRGQPLLGGMHMLMLMLPQMLSLGMNSLPTSGAITYHPVS